jgi:hypothetical protein
MEQKVAIRVKAISKSILKAMEKHGKRLDENSKARVVNDIPPLVYNSLNIVEEFEKHTKDCRVNKAAKKFVSHAIIQFPTTISATSENQQRFLDLAVEFINSTHGNNAVFAARLDRDEYGVNKVDVFYTPTYEKHTKSKGVERWMSLTKHPKELCERHRDEIERRHEGKFATGPRQCGIALNSELRAFLTERNFKLAPKNEKASKFSDWLTPEQYKLMKFAMQYSQLKKRLSSISKLLISDKVKISFKDKSTKNMLKTFLTGFYTTQDKNLDIQKETALKKPKSEDVSSSFRR